MRERLIRFTLAALAGARAESWLPAAADAGGVVVTLHHVEPRRLTRFAPNAHLSITPDFLDAFLLHFKAEGWRFVTVAEILESSRRAGDARRIAVTLDDGFRDNLQHAWPVFQRHSVPFTIYVCPGFCDRNAAPWWEALERIVAGTDSLSLPGDGPAEELLTRDIADKRRAFRHWADWLTTEADEAHQRQTIQALAARYGLDLAALTGDLIMDWDEIRMLAADPLCSIGAHTMTHPALARLPPQAAFREMQESAERIAAEIGVRPATVAFPYGYKAASGEREAGLAEQAGFAASFTTQPGYVLKTGGRQGLPRISVNGLYQDMRFLEVLLSPGLWKLRDRIRKWR